MKSVPHLLSSKDAVRSYKTSVNANDTYGVANKKISVFNGTPVRAMKVANLIWLATFTSLHRSVILYSKFN